MKIFSTVKNIHFVGIGGIGMSGIAEILLNQGFNISGSDMKSSENTEYLENLGAKVFIGHAKENIEEAEVVVYSSAVDPNLNPETSAAIKKGIPTIKRAVMLAEVARLNYCLAISGTHGKTTTTSMLGLILIKAGIDPTVIVGGRLRDFGGTNARLGKGEWTVVEADEYDRSFLQLSPTIAVINNIESDHLDIYKDINDIKNTFTEFANMVPFYGLVALGMDDPGVKEILSSINKKVVTFGLSRHSDYIAENINYKNGGISFIVKEYGKILGEITIKIPYSFTMNDIPPFL
jgi:UDP-N-acetylmuramate--alanine ligase